MGTRKDLVTRVTEQAADIIRLESENERLDRLQLNGPLAGIARTIDTELTAWVENGFVLDDATGLPEYDHDSVYDQAIRHTVEKHAASILSAASPETQIAVYKTVLTPVNITSMALQALGNLLAEKPEMIKELLASEDLGKLVLSLAKDERYTTALAQLTHNETKKDNTKIDLQAELDSKGSFSTAHLPTNAEVTINLSYEGKFYSQVTAKVVVAEDGEHWMSYLKEGGEGRLNPRFALLLSKYTHFRLGSYQDGKFVPEVVPNAKVAVITPKEECLRDTTVGVFQLDKQRVFLV